MKIFFIVLLSFCLTAAAAQDNDAYWKKWNTNYPERNITEMLHYEKLYADSVEKHPDIAPYYIRSDRYRFNGKFLGDTRLIKPDVISSMQNVLKLTGGNWQQLNELIEKEVLIQVGDEKIWMPIQRKVFEYFKDEVKPGENVTLYCAYLNEHTSKNILYNNFLISEFSK